MNAAEKIQEERAYFLSVINTFMSYREESHKRIAQREQSLDSLPQHHKKWLSEYIEGLEKLKQCVDKNAEFIPQVLKHAYTMFDNVYSTMEVAQAEEVGTLAEGLDKVQSVFKQLMRDWSSLGASEREQCYQPIIKEIVENFPAETCDRSTIQVLVPGAGLGRLAFEIASRGFRCQGNEFNLFMLIVSFYVLNLCSNVDEYVIYPWIHQYCNNHSIEDQMTSASPLYNAAGLIAHVPGKDVIYNTIKIKPFACRSFAKGRLSVFRFFAKLCVFSKYVSLFDMAWFFWILVLIERSSQIEAFEGPGAFHWDNPNVWQYETTCLSGPMPYNLCTTCAKRPFVSRIFNCQDSSEEETCSFQTVPQTSDDGCGLRNMFASLAYWEPASDNSTYWYPARRSMDYGPYEFTMWGGWYGLNVLDNITIERADQSNVFQKDCLVYDGIGGLVSPEFCQAMHRHNCSVGMFEKDDFCLSSPCVSCWNNDFCVTDHSMCPRRAPEGWNRYDPSPLCGSCQRQFNYCSRQVDMVLSFNRFLYLTVYYPECLYRRGHPEFIYCFTDAGDELRKRVRVKVVYRHIVQHPPSPNNFIVYQLTRERHVGQYWCEARGSRDEDREYQSNTLIAYEALAGSEFAVRLKIHQVCNFTDCSSLNQLNLLIDDVKQPLQRFAKVRLMKVEEFARGSYADLVVHASTYNPRPGVVADFLQLQELLQSYPEHIEVEYVRSSDYCLPGVYRNLTWPFARRFRTVLPSEICLQADGSPVSRFCDGDFLHGLHWREIYGNCSAERDLNQDTLLLQSYLNLSISQTVFQNVTDIVSTSQLTMIDLYIVSQFLDKSSQLSVNSSVLDGLLNVLDALLDKDLNLLFTAQETLNVTDSYLRASELLVLNMSEPSSLLKDKVIVHSFNPIAQNVSGFVLYRNHSIRDIQVSSGFEGIEDLEEVTLALNISTSDIDEIVASNLTNATVVALIYLNDKFFPSNTRNVADLVVNLNIPNYENYLQSPVPLLVNAQGRSFLNCAFWDYGDLREPKRGNWSSSGSSYEGTFNNQTNLHVCSYTHLTHLALLVLNKQNDESIEGTNDQILSVITAMGSLLSLFGILGIFLTSCLFRSWRDKSGTQILLHLSVATLLEIIFMYMNASKLFACPVAGCILQYVIISKFAWMLIYAFCQYLRFVRVFGPMPNHLLLKSIVFGWGFGVVPSAYVVISNPSTYYRERFCYPNGLYLFLGLYLPVVAALLINCCVFCKIMFELTRGKLDKFHSRSATIQHIKLAVLLFSVLGIPWLFGLISNFIPWDWLKVICVYIFTVGSIFQGFLMFLFYVIFNKETREGWKRLFLDQRNYQAFPSKKATSISSVS
ncbi:hypothetical protein HUJ04_012967 [Dendroctonus ponderosae]|nr:hypothetical protein HUJ04_012967 [Dendroctonus ponderosae]KAH1000664.1 hypothetical protein HUJ04_012967 [Dendroctonus ponderosae]